METKNKNMIGRREFLRRIGCGSSSIGGSARRLRPEDDSASRDRSAQAEIPTDRMTYRTNPKTGDRVSLLGYGCMRWPTVANGSARDSAERDRPGSGERTGRLRPSLTG